MDCGCIIAVDYDETISIRYCPLHKSAQSLYEALLDARDYIKTRMPETLGKDDHLEIINKAIAKARNQINEREVKSNGL